MTMFSDDRSDDSPVDGKGIIPIPPGSQNFYGILSHLTGGQLDPFRTRRTRCEKDKGRQFRAFQNMLYRCIITVTDKYHGSIFPGSLAFQIRFQF